MPILTHNKPEVRLSYDEMEAYLMLPSPVQDGAYTVAAVGAALDAKGICAGINRQKISDVIAAKAYDREILIAQGTEPINGTDGYYDYNFNSDLDYKPKILPDGSADYWSVNSIETVVEGQVIATYHPAVDGRDGVTVRGRVIPAKRGREQMPIKGKGFQRMNDNLTYKALLDGKIEMQNGRIVILPVHEIHGNAELAGGSIDFRGDIVIHGGVESGVVIRATGSITVEGIVEACTLEAGKGIILRSGMLGGNKASVKAKGAITAKFFEFTEIECESNLVADVLMECNVKCNAQIILDGARGSIIGGNVSAVGGIVVSKLGNNAEKRTEIFVGAGAETYDRIRVLEKEIETGTADLNQVEETLRQLEALQKEKPIGALNASRKTELLRTKIQSSATLASNEQELKRLQILVEDSRGACVSVIRQVYPGVIISIDEMQFTLKNMAKGVEFFKLPDKIGTRPCYYGVD